MQHFNIRADKQCQYQRAAAQNTASLLPAQIVALDDLCGRAHAQQQQNAWHAKAENVAFDEYIRQKKAPEKHGKNKMAPRHFLLRRTAFPSVQRKKLQRLRRHGSKEKDVGIPFITHHKRLTLLCLPTSICSWAQLVPYQRDRKKSTLSFTSHAIPQRLRIVISASSYCQQM